MSLAPIVLFVYNRPSHTLQTLDALRKNNLAEHSTLYIFCDGPKTGISTNQLEKLTPTRQARKQVQWSGEIIIYESEVNKGLANSIAEGVTEVINKHGKAIILEDDMITAPHFLTYMNDALNHFENNLEIGSINSYAERFLEKSDFPNYFLLNGSDCWGWATWKNRWADFTLDALVLKKQIITNNKIKDFEYGNHMQLLNDQIEGRIDTWDVQWHAVNILQERKGLYPKYSFIKNIGLDGSGTHCDIIEGFNEGLNLNTYSLTYLLISLHIS